MALQPPPQQIRQLLGGAYKWLTNLLHSLNNTQTATNSSLFVAGLTIQNNTPSGGKITWSSCTLFYQGIAYSIASGTTPNSELFVVWNVGQNVFTPVNSFTPGPTVFPIITNSQGFGDVTWDKLGANSVQAAHLFPVLTYDGPNGSLVISNVTFTDNSPATQVAWTACQATYQGVTYQIPAGHATNAAPFIIWQLSVPNQFQAVGAPLTINVDDFVIGQNLATGSPPAAGFFSRMQRYADRTGAYILMDETGFQGFNKNGHQTFFLLRQTTDGNVVGATCTLFICDGTGGAGQQQVAMKGNIPSGGNPVGGLLWTRPCTFALLPSTPAQGDRAMITDGAAFSFGAIAAGGGTTIEPVFYDGTNWRQG